MGAAAESVVLQKVHELRVFSGKFFAVDEKSGGAKQEKS